jgi:DNA-binding MarR family transcriptional regulator
LAAERSRLPAIASEIGLSEAQCLVLQALDPSASVAMCRIAETLDCDPSNVTGIVRRLEARGLVERRVDPDDRRVKNLALTVRGAAHRKRLLELLAEPPPSIRMLSAADQSALHAILERALGTGRGHEARRGENTREPARKRRL